MIWNSFYIGNFCNKKTTAVGFFIEHKIQWPQNSVANEFGEFFRFYHQVFGGLMLSVSVESDTEQFCMCKRVS